MAQQYPELDQLVSWQALLGYLNFSEGKPDGRFQKQFNDLYVFLVEHGEPDPWLASARILRQHLDTLRSAGSGPFRDTTQVDAVLALSVEKVLPAYQAHHADLLFHRSAAELFQPFFVVRVIEAVLGQGAPWNEEDRIVRGTLDQLNDFVGHRPIAILETRPRAEPYDHERVRPIPLYLRGAGVAGGRYQELIDRALEIIQQTDPALLRDASFDFELLDELALDPRAYDHGHPNNRRSNYVFGEWDPHHLDNQSRYRRFVVRGVTLEALLDRVENPGSIDRPEALQEAAAVLSGTILMASGVSGSSPATHDSFTSLTTLMPRIARYRDQFYVDLIKQFTGSHGARLRHEKETIRQPFGGARQHLNQWLGKHRAAQLQQRHLALVFAAMGYPDASRQHAAQIPTASIRIVSEMQARLTRGQHLADRGAIEEAATLFPEIEDLLHRGIAAGAIVDPWNILGFQGLYPLFQAQEDSVRDQRIDELLHLMASLFNLYDRLLCEAAGTGQKPLLQRLQPKMRALARWWDQFASVEVGEIRRVHGGEAAESAEHVSHALALWHERGEASADLAFWRQHLNKFGSPKAFARVIEALLRNPDYRAAMALLMTWLGRVEQVPLEDGDASFHELTLRWMLGLIGPADQLRAGDPGSVDGTALIQKFFDFLEANAEEYWHVPELETVEEIDIEPEEEEDDVYGAAYEGMTYQDSTDDDEESSVAEGGTTFADFALELEGERVGQRLRFLSTVARLWQIAVQKIDYDKQPSHSPALHATLDSWRTTAEINQRKLLTLLDSIHACQIPQPSGSYDANVEFDRRRVLKEQLLYATINTCLDTFLAVGTLAAKQSIDEPRFAAGPDGSEKLESTPAGSVGFPSWRELAGWLERSLLQGDVQAARSRLPKFLRHFQEEPLLFLSLADGGHPRQILRVRIAQTMLRALVVSLPRLGMLRETYHLLRIARHMEQARPPQGRGVSQFNELFQSGYQAVIESVVDSMSTWNADEISNVLTGNSDAPMTPEEVLAELMEKISKPFMEVWVDYSRSLQISALEGMPSDNDWQALRAFIRRYGRELFHARFMTLANLRGILHRGVGGYLDFVRDNPDPLHPVRLIEDLDRTIPRSQAERFIGFVLQALVENYEEFKDYNTTTPQSDYGENLHALLDFLKLKASYDRYGWHLRPLLLTHEVLVRKHQFSAAALWRAAFAEYNQSAAEQHLQALARLEQTHGMRLRTVSDRLEERFVNPLDLDRLCAWIQPAMEESSKGERTSFARLEEELVAYTATPQGVGLDVPNWLRRLELEVQRVWSRNSSLAVLAETLVRVPQKTLSPVELKLQLQEWETPLLQG